jgi:hypothetical protein
MTCKNSQFEFTVWISQSEFYSDCQQFYFTVFAFTVWILQFEFYSLNLQFEFYSKVTFKSSQFVFTVWINSLNYQFEFTELILQCFSWILQFEIHSSNLTVWINSLNFTVKWPLRASSRQTIQHWSGKNDFWLFKS